MPPASVFAPFTDNAQEMSPRQWKQDPDTTVSNGYGSTGCAWFVCFMMGTAAMA
jgi:surface antigen